MGWERFMKNKNVGYLVVCDDCEYNILLKDGRKYCGIEKDLPKLFYGDFYENNLDDRILSIYEKMCDNYFCNILTDFFAEVECAKELRDYCNTRWPGHECEIISFSLARYDRVQSGSRKYETEFIGYDVIFAGHWYSLILNTFFFKEDIFSKYLYSINEYGLFSNIFVIDQFVTNYRLMAKSDVCEPLGAENKYLILEINKIIV